MTVAELFRLRRRTDDRESLTVLIIGLNYAPEPTGIAPYTSRLARGLQERGHTVRVLTSHPHYPEWQIRPGYGQWTRRERVDTVAVTRLKHYVPAQPSGLKRLLSELSFGARVFCARWENPDVVVLVSPALFASALAQLRVRLSLNKPVVNVWLQDIYSLGITETGMGGGVVARIITGVEKALLNAANGVTVIHARFGHYLTDHLAVNPGRIQIVRNWTHLDPTPPPNIDAVRAGHGWAPGETIVLHAGNMGVKQGLANVVEAARLADAGDLPLRFVLLGNGSQRDELKQLGAGIRCLQFIDSLGNEGFQAALAAADVLLVNEKVGVSEMAVPSKLTSYFNAARPVLAATDETGVTASEIVASTGGVVVPAGQPQALVDAALALAADPTRAARLGANGLAYRHDVLGEKTAVDRYDHWLRKLATVVPRPR